MTVNAIAPGLTEVEATAYVPAERHEYYLQGRALTRAQVPDDVSGAGAVPVVRCRALRDRPVAAGQRRLRDELILSNSTRRKRWRMPISNANRGTSPRTRASRNGWTRASRASKRASYDWDALKFQADYDPKYRRAQMRYVGTGGTGVAKDVNTVPAGSFTFSTMVIPAGNIGPSHIHMDVEEMFFVIRGKMKVICEKDGETLGDHPRRPRSDLGAAGRVSRRRSTSATKTR